MTATEPGTPLVVLDDLCIHARRASDGTRQPDRALVDGVSLTIRAGRITALVGHSGSGKSLTARAILGVVDVEPGLVRGSLRYPELTGDLDWLAGVRGARAQRRLQHRTAQYRGSYTSYAPQSAASALNPGRTIGRQLELALARRAAPPSDRAGEIRRILDEVGLPPRTAAALPTELSGGMAQRAALAIAVAPAPRVMIADEPETGLDPVLRRVVTELMVQVAADHQVALLLITHNMDTVHRIADDVVRIAAGAAAGSAA
ncbi:MAG: ATP-binding cassette domain-containing protein [Myxococcota bacterium]